MPTIKVRDENGEWVKLPVMKGDKGDPGSLEEHTHSGDDIILVDAGTEPTYTGIRYKLVVKNGQLTLETIG